MMYMYITILWAYVIMTICILIWYIIFIDVQDDFD